MLPKFASCFATPGIKVSLSKHQSINVTKYVNDWMSFAIYYTKHYPSDGPKMLANVFSGVRLVVH